MLLSRFLNLGSSTVFFIFIFLYKRLNCKAEKDGIDTGYHHQTSVILIPAQASVIISNTCNTKHLARRNTFTGIALQGVIFIKLSSQQNTARFTTTECTSCDSHKLKHKKRTYQVWIFHPVDTVHITKVGLTCIIIVACVWRLFRVCSSWCPYYRENRAAKWKQNQTILIASCENSSKNYCVM